jgi:hypothetical protein
MWALYSVPESAVSMNNVLVIDNEEIAKELFKDLEDSGTMTNHEQTTLGPDQPWTKLKPRHDKFWTL